jgi:hypothetical protein
LIFTEERVTLRIALRMTLCLAPQSENPWATPVHQKTEGKSWKWTPGAHHQGLNRAAGACTPLMRPTNEDILARLSFAVFMWVLRLEISSQKKSVDLRETALPLRAWQGQELSTRPMEPAYIGRGTIGAPSGTRIQRRRQNVQPDGGRPHVRLQLEGTQREGACRLPWGLPRERRRCKMELTSRKAGTRGVAPGGRPWRHGNGFGS